MKKTFVTKEKLEEITQQFPTPFHLYDEKGIRENVQELYDAFSWNKGYKEFFAVKATPNPFLIKILHEYGCGTDCSSMTELMLSEAICIKGHDIMFSSGAPGCHRAGQNPGPVTIRADCSRSAMTSWTILGIPSMV